MKNEPPDAAMVRSQKGKILAVAAILAVPVLLAFFNDELRQRYLSYWCNIGEITLTVDGKIVPLSNIPITFKAPGSETEEGVIINGAFRFRSRDYGRHYYSFSLPSSLWGGQGTARELVFDLSFMNGNWWHVNEVKLKIDITTTPSLRALVSGQLNTPPDSFGYDSITERFSFRPGQIEINSENNLIEGRSSNI